MVDTRREYDRLAGLYLPIAIGVFVVVVVLVVVFALRWRVRSGAPERAASRVHSAPRLEALYVLVLAAVAAFLLTATFRTEAKTDRALGARGGGPLVAVVAAKWRWRFTYPGSGIVQQGATPELVVPAGEPVRFTLISRDVIHSLWIPFLAFKRAAYPRFVQRFTLTFPAAGYHRAGGECAEYCGLYHDQMRFDVRVLEPAAFAAWERARGAAAT
ncbi:MAG TPA: cytochrome c oxidase subunit II [Conexibacter sp.]|nr:cytochrome c oxidase subunit II [Conexibacter sp.]